MRKRILYLIICIGLLVLGGFGGLLIEKKYNNSICKLSKFKYINSQLNCELKYVVDKRAYAQLKIRLQKLIDEKTESGELENVSIYFRDLQYGPTLGINEHEKFSPASLLKLPLLLTYLNYSNGQNEFLERRITIPEIEDVYEPYFPPKYSVKSGTSYSIDEILNYMIKYSDNVSYNTLRTYLKEISPNQNLFMDIFADLGIIDPQTSIEETISVKSYASIFVQLYNSSFMENKDLSEAALGYLSNTDFTEGIVAGIPGEISVSHKFGERSGFEDGLNQLHDCGIIYYPENPYLLCVMSRGRDFEELKDTIATISKMVYDEFDSRKLN